MCWIGKCCAFPAAVIRAGLARWTSTCFGLFGFVGGRGMRQVCCGACLVFMVDRRSCGGRSFRRKSSQQASIDSISCGRTVGAGSARSNTSDTQGTAGANYILAGPTAPACAMFVGILSVACVQWAPNRGRSKTSKVRGHTSSLPQNCLIGLIGLARALI